MNEIFDLFKDLAVFLVVYVSEAHAIDEWPLGRNVCVVKHQCIEERIDVAKRLLIEERGCRLNVLVDTMENDFERIYKGWPERFFIIRDFKMALIAEPSVEDKGFNREEVFWWLSNYKKSLNGGIDVTA